MMFKKNLLNQILLLSLILGLVFSPQIALAYDADFFSANDILFYNPDDTSDCYSPSSTDIADGKNIETVLRFFVEQKGLSLEAAAGITGNLMLESGYNINPKAENSIGAFGVAQWLDGRRTNLEKFAESKNKPADDLITQLEFLWYELETEYVKSILKPYSEPITPEKAAGLFNDKFERAGESPDDAIYIKRQTYAVEAYNLAVSLKLVSKTIQSTSLTTGCSELADTGKGGWDLEGDNAMVFYEQSDPKWGDKLFGQSKIKDCGSGPTSLASIVATVTGDKSVNPENMSSFFASHGGQADDGCSSTWNWDVIEDQYNLKVESRTIAFDEIKLILEDKGLVLLVWEGQPFASSLGETTNLIIRKIDENGALYIANPKEKINSEQNNKAWDETSLIKYYIDDTLAGLSKGMWGITKK